MSLFLSLWLAAFTFAVESPVCLPEGKIRYELAGRTRVEPASYCYDATRSSLRSLSCREGRCEARRVELCSRPLPSITAFGSPGFRFCRDAGGLPHLLEFHDGVRWWSMDRCLFEKDGSFVDTGDLLARRAACKKN